MSTLEMDAIVAEVLRRIGLSTCSRRALLWLGHASDDMAVWTFLNSLEQESYVFTQILRRDEEPCRSLRAVHQVIPLGEESALHPLSDLIRLQDLVVVSGLTLAQLSNIRDLRIGQEIEELICEALRQGKRVCAFSDALDVSTAADGFASKILQLRKELESCGMEFQVEPAIPRTLRQLYKPVISKQDLLDIEDGAIVVGRNTVFTTSAKQLLDDRNLEVICQ